MLKKKFRTLIPAPTALPRCDAETRATKQQQKDQLDTKNTSEISLRPSTSSAARYVPAGKCSTEMGSFDCDTRLRLNTCLAVAASSTISDTPVVVPASQRILTGSSAR